VFFQKKRKKLKVTNHTSRSLKSHTSSIWTM